MIPPHPYIGGIIQRIDYNTPMPINYQDYPHIMAKTFGIDLHTVYNLISYTAITFIAILVMLHLLSRIMRPKPLALGPDSTILIVGGCEGVGLQMAISIAQQYHSTILVVDHNRDLFEDVAHEIKKHNGICECFYCDLSDPTAVRKLISSIRGARPVIDLLVYNAAILMPAPAWENSQETLSAVMNVNFFTPIAIINGLLKNVEKSRGQHIAVVASMASIIPGGKNLSSYHASRHAIFAYISSLRLDLKHQRSPITISIGCPYAVDVPMMENRRTRIDRMLPKMNSKYVAQRLVQQFVAKKEVCYIGRKHAIFVKILMLLPTVFVDKLMLLIDTGEYPAAQPIPMRRDS